MALRTPLTVSPFMYIGDSTGRPLDYGRVYFGEPNKDPEFYPIDIYSDEDMTKPLAQPIRTKGGFMYGNGDMVEAHAAEVQYSVKVLDQYGRKVLYKGVMYRNNVSDFLVDEIERATAAENLITNDLTAETQRAIAAEKVIADAVVIEKDRAVAAEVALDIKHAALSSTINSLGGGKKAYTTYALMVADKNNIAANSSIDVTNDTDPLRNGTYSYDGAVFAKSIYDVETIVRTKVLNTFKTKALMDASALPDGADAQVTDDTVNNGLYVKTAGAWVKSAYDPLAQAKTYADANKLDYSQIEVAYRDGNLIGAKTERHLNLGVTSARAISATSFYDSIIVRVNAGDTVYLFNDSNAFSNANGSNYAFFANNPFVDQTQINVAHTFTAMTDTTSNINYNAVKVPSGANYLLLNSRRTNSNGTRYDYQWAVHKDVFRASYVAGREYVARIAGTQVRDTEEFTEAEYRISTKNLYRGKLQIKARLVGTVVQITTSDNDVISPYIPVEYGKSYTISGLQPAGLRDIYTLVHGTSADFAQSHVKTLATSFSTGVVTVTIDDPAIKYIVFSLTGAENSSYQQAKEMLVQVEEGLVATKYEPNVTSDITNILLQLIDAGTGGSTPPPTPTTSGTKIVSQFNELDVVRDPNYVTLTPIEKQLAPLGISYSVLSSEDSAGNNLFAQVDAETTGNKSVYAYLMKTVADVKQVGVLKHTPFTVPSGSLDNPESFAYVDKYPNYLTVHPSIAYTETPIAGFKYWMVSSTFPPTSEGGVLWEDEDLFVSNDAKNWQRVRSMYETDKSYTTSALRLPPQSIVTTGARKNAFLPSPVVDSVFEVSFPANNGQLAVERQNFTVGNGLPWKHDPYLLIDGGYVYVYHSFNLFFKEGGAKKSHFFVCVRTSNGIDWDFVRADGSTLRITEETSRQVFTKGADGKYNYLSYAYDNSRSNPEVIKFGANDYTLFYGRNFTEKFQSTTPYGFDFDSGTVVKDLGNMNHPTLILVDGVLYNLSNYYCHTSVDRGTTWTQLPHYPLWRGGVYGFNYKKSNCIGEGGKFIVADVVRISAQAYEVNTRAVANDVNTMNLFEFSSFSDFLNKANNGLVDAYIDVQITKVNLDTKSRTVINLPNISLTNAALGGNLGLQRLKIAELNISAGDVIYFNISLNSRNGGNILFGGIELV